MTQRTGTWSTWLVGAGCAVVIVVGAFAISGHNAGDTGPKAGSATPRPGASAYRGTGTPATPATAAPHSSRSATPHGTPAPRGTAIASPPPHASASATASAATSPVASPSPVGSQHPAAVPAGVLGTFSYATTGYEQTSLPGTKRTFPSTTTITNKAAGCGVESTWKPVSEHVQTQELCPEGTAIRMASYDTTISFFGISSGERFTCGNDAFIYQPGVKAGHVWNYKCSSADATATEAGHVLGYSTLSVGGTSVRVLHVRVDVRVTGAESGTSTQDYWIETAKPVLVKESGTVDATQQGVQYQERYSLTLESLTPKS
ncbi:MAG TPA: hypothetical protein VG899_12215 [Mycobacteriales bacterium]|nr:hypothetical protein [Mycobacteriales bacterium]